MTCPKLLLIYEVRTLFPPALHRSLPTAILFLLLSKHVMHRLLLIQCPDIFVSL